MASEEQSARTKMNTFLESVPLFSRLASDASEYLHNIAINRGEENRELADLLHGKPLGHPLHPILTDITIGGWSFGFLFDVLSFLTGSKAMRHTADRLTVLGTLSAIPTALSGLTDYSAIKKEAASYGAAHGILNGIAFFFYVRSSIARLTGSRGSAFFFALLGIGAATASSWLGGELVYKHRVGVNHATLQKINDWTPALPLTELEVETLTRVEVNDIPVLLYKRDDEAIYAIGAVCSHAGGPLDEGRITEAMCVECPWHQSVFELETGHNVHGPSTYNQPRYQVRIQDNQIEVRSWPSDTPQVSKQKPLTQDTAEEIETLVEET